MLVLGFDIGGTNTRCVLADVSWRRFRVRAAWSFSTPQTRRAFLDALTEAISEGQRRGKKKLAGIGIGIPGPLSADRTKILAAPNAPQIHRLALPSILQKKFPIPVRMENDADVFAFAEAQYGAGKSSQRVLGITLGTGVGGGLITDGKIDRGAHGSAGEIGHMVVVANGRRCSCGGKGHLEEYISHRAFVRETGEMPKMLLQKARRGNKRAIRQFAHFGGMLGIGIASAVNLWDPDIVVVGGGIGNAGEFLLRSAKEIAQKEILSPISRRSVKIKKAHFGKYAGAIGATLLFQEERM